jgi:Fic family protein
MLAINAIKISPALLKSISEIDEFKGLWSGLEQHTTGLHLLGDVADHGGNFQKLLGPLKEQPITPDIIKVLNASQIGEKGASDFKNKSIPLPISDGVRVFGTLDTAEPEQVAPVLEKLCGWLNENLDKGELHPLIVIAVFSAVFIQLGPFETGNLRTIRFLIMLMMLKTRYTYAPYVSLAPIMEAQAEGFYKGLKHQQDSLEEGRPDWSEWLLCFMGILKAQKDTLYTRLNDKEPELQNLPVLSAKVMRLFQEHTRLQMKEIIKLTNGRRATLKLRLNELVDAGYLKRHGKARATWYSLV